jgi:hypothetical protein
VDDDYEVGARDLSPTHAQVAAAPCCACVCGLCGKAKQRSVMSAAC